MNKRTYVLCGILAVLALCYAWFVLLPTGGELQVMPVERPQRPLSFIFNRDVAIEGVKVIRYESTEEGQGEGGYERTVWELVADPEKASERREEDSVMYGRRLRGLRVPEGQSNRPEPLERGARYRFELQAVSGEQVAIDFVPRFGRG